MDLRKLLNLRYLFEPYPAEPLSRNFLIVLLLFFIASLILAIVAGSNRNKAENLNKKLWRRWQIWGWSNGSTGLLLVAFREAGAIYLASRIWLSLWLLAAFIWLIFIIKYWFLTIPAKKRQAQKEAEFKKWLPEKQ